MTFGKRLIKARENKGYKQNQFAEMLKITATRLNYWEKDKREPDVAMIKKISSLLEVSSDWLIGNDEYSKSSNNFLLNNDNEKFLLKKYRSLDKYGQEAVEKVLDVEYERCTNPNEASILELPISELKVSAGVGEWLDYERFDTIRIIDTPEARKADIVIEVDGDSMEPKFNDGDKVLVRLQPAVEVGEIGIFTMDNQGYIKQYADDRLISLNPDYDDIYPSEYSDTRCIGKVIGKAIEAE